MCPELGGQSALQPDSSRGCRLRTGSQEERAHVPGTWDQGRAGNPWRFPLRAKRSSSQWYPLEFHKLSFAETQHRPWHTLGPQWTVTITAITVTAVVNKKLPSGPQQELLYPLVAHSGPPGRDPLEHFRPRPDGPALQPGRIYGSKPRGQPARRQATPGLWARCCQLLQVPGQGVEGGGGSRKQGQPGRGGGEGPRTRAGEPSAQRGRVPCHVPSPLASLGLFAEIPAPETNVANSSTCSAHLPASCPPMSLPPPAGGPAAATLV